MADLVVAGAGMAGLVAAAEARSLGADVVVYEKGSRLGGSMLLSSGVIWRHREFDHFRAECPGGSEALQRGVYRNLDTDLDWLESLGARVLEHRTGNPRTVGKRFSTASLTDALARHGGRVRLESPLRELPDGTPAILATGGFQASPDLLREHVTEEPRALFLRAAPWSTGDGLRLALDAGAATTPGMGEIFGRAMPAPPARVTEADFVPLAQLYARRARVRNLEGDVFEPRTWSEIDVLQWMARQPRARAVFELPNSALEETVSGRTVGAMVAGAERAGAPVHRSNGSVEVGVVAGVTTTLGGIAVDAECRAAPGIWAAGADVGGISTGGYASGLAAALVLGRIAARSALGAA